LCEDYVNNPHLVVVFIEISASAVGCHLFAFHSEKDYYWTHRKFI